MSRPSAPLVERLRQIIEARGLVVAELALGAGIPVERLRQVLAGEASMTVDELIVLSQGLALEPADLGVEVGVEVGVEGEELPYDPPEDDAATDVHQLPFAADPPVAEVRLSDVLDPVGNQVQQLFEVGFGLGCTFFFQARTDDLQESGIPEGVLKRYAGGEVPIQLDAAYHVYNEPEFSSFGLTIKLSFDAVYTCTFPWSSIQRIAFFPEVPEPDDEPEDEEEEPPGGGAPFLRLVE